MDTNVLSYKTEDEVRDEARIILGFNKKEKGIRQGTGQITSFNLLGFKGINNRPDGWYLPNDYSKPAIILETKSEKEDIDSSKFIDELIKNCNITKTKYNKVIGILYNGINVKIFKNCIEVHDISSKLQNKTYYLNLFLQEHIDKQRIYNLTKRINDCLNFDFGIENLRHRMIFTACALVAKRYGAMLIKGMIFSIMKSSILETLSNSLSKSKQQNIKIDILINLYSEEIKLNNKISNQEAVDNFIKWVSEISDCISLNSWNGEDVMGIFFNEFSRYEKKRKNGQVFTPDHITSFMYRLLEVNQNDRILDAACGSGAFLVKSMCNMIKESGGVETKKADDIKETQLFGIELHREIFALACANMLIHKDGKTNLEQLDSRTPEACQWIKSKSYETDKNGNFKTDENGNMILTKNHITKVLMNPPFENKCGCINIVENVLDNIPPNTKCAFILPDKKLEKVGKAKPARILKKHTLEKIIKLPEKTFINNTTTSIFIFTSGIPQNKKEIFACYIEDDGLETVKNQGRQDTKNKWNTIEDKWIDIIKKQNGSETIQWINPCQHLSYQMPEACFSVTQNDFSKTVVDYLRFKNLVDVKIQNDELIKKILYSGHVTCKNGKLTISVELNNPEVDIDSWKPFKLGKLFIVEKPIARVKTKYFNGNTPFVASGSINNGVQDYFQPEKGEILDKAGCITVSPLDGSAFYQPVDFLGRGGAGSSILILRNDYINQYSAQFICTTIRIALSKYVYNDMVTDTKLKKEIILLPALHDKNGNVQIDKSSNNKFSDEGYIPDWDYMEHYMKNIIKKHKDSINLLCHI